MYLHGAKQAELPRAKCICGLPRFLSLSDQPVHVALLVGMSFPPSKVVDLIPRQGTYLGFRFDLRSGAYGRQLINAPPPQSIKK